MACAIALASTSCGDPPELVAKREQQKAEIAKLEGEIALIDEKLRTLPPDVTEELEKAKKEETQQTEEIARLEAEISDLEARKRSLDKEFLTYRVRYATK
jgi:chromosome segregation ATPase